MIKLLLRFDKISEKISFFLIILAVLISFYTLEPPPTDFVMLAGIGFALLSIIINRRFNFIKKYDWFLVAFLVFSSLQAVLSKNTNLLFHLVTVYLVFSYFAIKYVLVDKERVKKFISVYIISTLITAVSMILQLILFYTFDIKEISRFLYAKRPAGFFKDANVAGPTSVLSVVMLSYKYIEKGDFLRFLLPLFVVSLGIFISFSRTAVGGLGLAGLGFLIIFWPEINKNRKRLLAIIAALFLIASFLLLYAPTRELTVLRYTKLLQKYDIGGRFFSWNTGLRGIVNNLGGSGSGSFESLSLEEQRREIEEEGVDKVVQDLGLEGELGQGDIIVTKSGETKVITKSAHSTYLRVLRENGIVGFLLMVAFFASLTAVSFKRIYRNHKKITWIVKAAFVGYIVYLASGLVIDTLHWRILWYTTALLSASLEIDYAEKT